MKTLARLIYAVFGTLVIGLSVLVLVRPTIALPFDDRTPLTAHLVQEQGAEGLVVGLMAFWCLRNFERRRAVHLTLLAFALAFAAIHWLEFLHGRRSLASPMMNSLPLLLLLAATPRRRRAGGPKEGRSTRTTA